MDTIVLPTAEQEQRAKWDLLLLDLEYRAEQVRQLKHLEPWRLALSGMTAGAAIFGGGAAVAALILKLGGWLP